MKKNISISPNFIFALVIVAFMIMPGCKKNPASPVPAAVNGLLDSIVRDSLSIHFVYDSQDRVIETRMSKEDTLMQRYTYEYTGTDNQPFKRNYYERSRTVPECTSILFYNANGQKIKDSCFVASGGLLVTLDYSITGKICILQRGFVYSNPSNVWQQRADTVFLNAAGDMDSLRIYSDPYGNGNFTYMYSRLYNQYSTVPNYIRSLSICNSDFYIPDLYLSNFAGPENYIRNESMPLDCFYNQFTCTSWSQGNSNTSFGNVDCQYQYNTSNQPTFETLTYTGPSGVLFIHSYRFVYL